MSRSQSPGEGPVPHLVAGESGLNASLHRLGPQTLAEKSLLQGKPGLSGSYEPQVDCSSHPLPRGWNKGIVTEVEGPLGFS